MILKIMKLISLAKIEYEQEFWKGTMLRHYYNENEDYYDYILALALWEKSMLVINVTSNDSSKGSVYSGVIPFSGNPNKYVVTRNGFEHTFGKELEGWFLIEDD